jgi:hypothetical protein
MVSMFLLISCTDLQEIIGKQNVIWKTDDNLFKIYVEGPDKSTGSGMFNIDNQLIEVVVYFGWNIHTLECASLNKTNANYTETLIAFSMSAEKKQSNKMTLKCGTNKTGISKLDKITLEMTREDIEEDSLDAKKYIGSIWESSDLSLLFKRTPASYFTNILESYDSETKAKSEYYFLFTNNNDFEIHHNSEVGILAGFYITNNLEMILTVEYNSLFNGEYSIMSFIASDDHNKF